MMIRTAQSLTGKLLTPLFALIFLAPLALLAQGTTASVSGFVTDASGAKVPDATVTFTNTATGSIQTAKTNTEGAYRLAGLAPGLYRSMVSQAGFKTTVREGIDLHVEDQASVDYSLVVGATTENVTVNASAALVETESPTVSQVIEGRQVQDTPLNGRNVMNLVTLTPGVIPQGATSGNTSNNTNGGAFTNPFAFNNYQIAGGLAGQSSVYLDGTPLNLAVGHQLPFVAPQDAIQEFKVETSVVNPQYGEFGGGVINFATKSGTAAIHGTIYEFLRNNIFNANNFFSNQTIVNGGPVPRPEFTQNQFGATVGAPLNKSKSAFFFLSYEGFRLALGVPNVGRVPTPAELSGNFTADAPIFDPTTAIPIPGTGIYAAERQFSCNGVANMICQNRIDSTSNFIANTLKYFPAPNATSANPGINFSQNGRAGADNNSYTARADQNIGEKQKLFARYSRYDGNQPGTVFLNNPIGPTSTPANMSHFQQFAIGDSIVLSQTSLLDLRLSYLRQSSAIVPQSGANLSGFGPAYAALAPQIKGTEFPDIVISNLVTNPFTNSNPSTNSKENNYVISGVYSKVAGKHSLNFGGEARRREEYFNFSLSSSGFFVFAGTSTACIPYLGASTCRSPSGAAVVPFTLPGGGATPIADFLTGVITVAPLGFQESIAPSAINYYAGVFANDTFQISPRLTLTAGVRYEIPRGYAEKHDRETVLLPQQANPLALVNSSAYPSRDDLENHNKLFSPRIGIAFAPYTGTSVRAGYSLAFLPVDTVYSAGPNGSPINSPITFVVPGAPLSNPLLGSPAGPTTLLQPIGRAFAQNPFYFAGQTITSRIANSSFPYLEQWNANVQQSISATAAIQFAYLGARGEHLPIFGTVDINQLPDQYDAAPSQSLRPYPLYQNVNAQSPYMGDSYYNSAQVTFSKRFSVGGTFLASYGWSKFLSNSESTQSQVESHTQGMIQDYTNLRAERSYLSFDVPQRLVVSYVLDLPFGKGKHFLSNDSELVDRLIGGWNVGGINTLQSGYPLAIIAVNNNLANLYGAGQIRPNVVVGCNKSIGGSIVGHAQSGAPVLNANCFTAPAANAFGDEPRTDGMIRDQGIDNWDFSLAKTTTIRESVNLVFRAEAFNVANRVQFGDPNTNSASTLFGVITTQNNQPRLIQFSLRANY